VSQNIHTFCNAYVMCTLDFVMVYVLWRCTLCEVYVLKTLRFGTLTLCAATFCNSASCDVYVMLLCQVAVVVHQWPGTACARCCNNPPKPLDKPWLGSPSWSPLGPCTRYIFLILPPIKKLLYFWVFFLMQIVPLDPFLQFLGWSISAAQWKISIRGTVL
jgi:hypothetical protein